MDKNIQHLKNVGKMFNVDDGVFENLNNALEGNQENLSESEIKELQANCDYVPFEIHEILKDINCNFLPSLEENKEKYDISDISNDLAIDSPDINSNQTDPFEVTDFSNSNLLSNSNNCTSQVLNLSSKLTDVNSRINNKQKQLSELLEDELKVRIKNQQYQGKIDYLRLLDDFNFEDYNNLDVLLSNYDQKNEFYQEYVITIFDFVTYNQSKINDYNNKIPSSVVNRINDFFNVNLENYHFDRSDPNYITKRFEVTDQIENILEELKEQILHSAYYSEANNVDDEISDLSDSSIEDLLLNTQEKYHNFKSSDDYKNYIIRINQLRQNIDNLTNKREELEKRLKEFECDDSVPELNVDVSEPKSTQEAPIVMSNPRNTYTPLNKEYWDRWASQSTLVNLTNPAQFWPIGLLIPTPGGILRIPLPIIWNSIAVIPTPVCLVVVFLGICGLCPSPFVMVIDFMSQSTRFIISLRGPKTIRSKEQTTSQINKSLEDQKNSQFGTFVSRGQRLFDLPLVEDDLPDYSRLSILNIPFAFQSNSKPGMLTAFNRKGKEGGGFFENP